MRKTAKVAVELEREVASLGRELDESLRQQAATADVLKVISGAAFDLRQVFETVAEHAVRLCEADKAFIFRFDGELLKVVVSHNASPELRDFTERNPIRPGRHSGAARAALEHRTVQIADVRADPEYTYGAREADSIRTVLGVPMLKGDALLGVMMIYRLEVRPFTDRQIALVETFADQAAIAIENARLLAELRESLEQQTATGEVLHVIASSPGEVERVLDTIARTAHQLFGAWATSITRIEGGVFRQAAAAGEHRQSLAAHLSRQAVNRNIAAGLAAVEKRVVHIENLKAEMARFPESPPPARLAGSSVTAPLLQSGEAIGTITVTRLEVRPFTDKEIALLEGFAAQAVIAIENARLLTELRESLDFQIATGDVLKAISRTTFDLDPVLTTMAETAMRLCRADKAVLFRTGDDGMLRFAAGYSLDPDYIAHERRSVLAPGRGSIVGRAALERSTVQILDAWNDPEYADPEAARIGNVRAMLGVPLIREGEIIGAFGLGRAEPNPYTQKQVELVTTFADQAVIAIENVRLLTELRESLETQTASADILRTIAASPADASRALDAIAQTTARLFGGSGATIRTIHGKQLRVVGASGEAGERLRAVLGEEYPIDSNTLPGTVVLEKRPVHVPDIDHPDPTVGHWPGIAPQRAAGVRTVAGTPLLREGQAIGALMVQRSELKPFTDTEMAQLANFADQAVIAIENARLLDELNTRNRDLAESLDQQTATSEILRVIASTPGEPHGALNTIAETAARMFNAISVSVRRLDGDVLRAVGSAGQTAFLVRSERPTLRLDRNSLAGRALAEKHQVQIEDIDSAVADGGEVGEMAGLLKATGVRTSVATPMLREGRAIGAIVVHRGQVRPFSEKELQLLRGFADQAVIAIENARLLDELNARNRDLAESLDQQTATAEILRSIASSPAELERSLDTICETAARMFGASSVGLRRVVGAKLPYVGAAGPRSNRIREEFPELPLDRGNLAGLAILEKRQIEIEDPRKQAMNMRLSRPDSIGEKVGFGGSIVSTPLLRETEAIGAMVVTREDVRPFSGKELKLMAHFADQAVIAIENARLLAELRESLDQQTATAEILGVIASYPSEPSRALDRIAETAARMFGASSVNIRRVDGNVLRSIGTAGPVTAEIRKNFPETPVDRTTPLGEAVLDNRQINIEDGQQFDEWDSAYLTAHRLAIQLGTRSAAYTPLSRDGRAIGAMVVNRKEVRPFVEKELQLMNGFAAQAVIAIENARLLAELRESLERQTATADVLGIISRSPGEVEPVFDAMLENAIRLCEGQFGVLYRRDGEAFYATALRNVPADYAKALEGPLHMHPDTALGRMMRTCQPVHIVDLGHDAAYRSGHPAAVAAVEVGGVQTLLAVPMIKEGDLIGAIAIYRRDIRPFTDKQQELVAGFAAQAVIAIENARLLGELRARTDELAQRQAELRVTFDNMGDGVVMFDDKLRLAAWNTNLQQILDIPNDFLAEPRTFRDYLSFLTARGEFAGDTADVDWSRYDDNVSRSARFERVRPDGRVLEVRRNPVPGGGFVLIYSDITERKRAEEQVRAARDAAERALGDLKAAQANLIQAEKMASLGQLTAGIAHEIKNPLNFVNNFAGLSVELLDELKEYAELAIAGLDQDKRSDAEEVIGMLTGNLQKIAEHGRRADGIVKSMLAHSRGGSGDRQTVNVNALVEESLNLAYHGARAQDQNFNVRLERDLDPAVAPIEVVPQDLTRVFLNLFGNGFYAVNKRRREAGEPAYSPVLKVTTRERGDDVVIRIRDNGIGIPPEIKAKLFEPFFTTKPTGEGTGLGLSISYDIVTQEHGGAIEVDSKVGEFTEFCITLPRRAVPAAAANR